MFPESSRQPNEVSDTVSHYESGMHETVCLISRLHTPVIYDQIVEMILAGEQDKAATSADFIPRSRTEIQEWLNWRIREIETDTPIAFTDEDPTGDAGDGREEIPVFWRLPTTDEVPTNRQMEMVEAHEKGHVVRPYQGEFYRRFFSPGFDASAVQYTDENLAIDRRYRDNPDMTLEEARKLAIEYLFSGEEVAERMSQLKNYMGFTDATLFTKEHLEYARKHYVADVGYDNRMTQFLQAITPGTEEKFLQLINGSGI
jgi:hypothetical protein